MSDISHLREQMVTDRDRDCDHTVSAMNQPDDGNPYEKSISSQH